MRISTSSLGFTEFAAALPDGREATAWRRMVEPGESGYGIAAFYASEALFWFCCHGDPDETQQTPRDLVRGFDPYEDLVLLPVSWKSLTDDYTLGLTLPVDSNVFPQRDPEAVQRSLVFPHAEVTLLVNWDANPLGSSIDLTSTGVASLWLWHIIDCDAQDAAMLEEAYTVYAAKGADMPIVTEHVCESSEIDLALENATARDYDTFVRDHDYARQMVDRIRAERETDDEDDEVFYPFMDADKLDGVSRPLDMDLAMEFSTWLFVTGWPSVKTYCDRVADMVPEYSEWKQLVVDRWQDGEAAVTALLDSSETEEEQRWASWWRDRYSPESRYGSQPSSPGVSP